MIMALVCRVTAQVKTVESLRRTREVRVLLIAEGGGAKRGRPRYPDLSLVAWDAHAQISSGSELSDPGSPRWVWEVWVCEEGGGGMDGSKENGEGHTGHNPQVGCSKPEWQLQPLLLKHSPPPFPV